MTPREREVLRRLTAGGSNRAIARDLAIGERTVGTHVARILAELAVDRRADAVAEAFRRGLV